MPAEQDVRLLEPEKLRHLGARRRRSGVIAVAAAALLWGTIGAANTFRPANADPLAVSAVRVAVGGALLLGWALILGQAQPLIRSAVADARQWSSSTAGRGAPLVVAMIALGAASVAAYQLSFFTALTRAGVAIGTVVSMSTPPIFAGLLVLLRRTRRFSAWWALSTAITVGGCALLAVNGSGSRLDGFGIGMAAVAGVSFTAYSSAAAKLIEVGFAPSGVMGVLFAGGGFLLLPVLLILDAGWMVTTTGLALTGYLAVAATAVAYALYGRGLRSVPLTTSATLTLADPLMAAVLGFTIIGEPTTPTVVCGLILLFSGLVLTARVRA